VRVMGIMGICIYVKILYNINIYIYIQISKGVDLGGRGGIGLEEIYIDISLKIYEYAYLLQHPHLHQG
jgi:hypothetical protein